MEITIYELLGLVKDGKAPKKIKYSNAELEYNEGCEDYYSYYGNGLFEYKFGNCKNFLNGEVEIIEEQKKIKKLDLDGYYDDNSYCECKSEWCSSEDVLVVKINEIIDEINNLKENK